MYSFSQLTLFQGDSSYCSNTQECRIIIVEGSMESALLTPAATPETVSAPVTAGPEGALPPANPDETTPAPATPDPHPAASVSYPRLPFWQVLSLGCLSPNIVSLHMYRGTKQLTM